MKQEYFYKYYFEDESITKHKIHSIEFKDNKWFVEYFDNFVNDIWLAVLDENGEYLKRVEDVKSVYFCLDLYKLQEAITNHYFEKTKKLYDKMVEMQNIILKLMENDNG